MFDQDSSRNAAGYFNSPSKFDSPADDQKKQVRRQHNVVPITISQILKMDGDSLKVGDTEVHLATFVGLVKSVETSSTKVTYSIQDDTGTVECNYFIESSESGETSSPTVMENSYYRVIGSVRMMQGKPHVMALQLYPLAELNELTTHLLEVIHLQVKSKKLQQKREMQIKPPQDDCLPNSLMGVSFDNRGGNTTSSYDNAGGMMNGLTPTQQVVYNTIQNCMDHSGIKKVNLINSLRGRVSAGEIEYVRESSTLDCVCDKLRAAEIHTD
ncbi:hypothetical protein J437_LFUL007040 [Ladona fulva]|uniref:Replication protein A 32 kDa subunit n=1 Tax=Ladona fulva TaxID=123851 RepID=A0A8K0P0B3_LADFU|nr:hypothetical protein J437_LFUL007040 [Ladona fulva]